LGRIEQALAVRICSVIGWRPLQEECDLWVKSEIHIEGSKPSRSRELITLLKAGQQALCWRDIWTSCPHDCHISFESHGFMGSGRPPFHCPSWLEASEKYSVGANSASHDHGSTPMPPLLNSAFTRKMLYAIKYCIIWGLISENQSYYKSWKIGAG
jgi:hypothetical protein